MSDCTLCADGRPLPPCAACAGETLAHVGERVLCQNCPGDRLAELEADNPSDSHRWAGELWRRRRRRDRDASDGNPGPWLVYSRDRGYSMELHYHYPWRCTPISRPFGHGHGCDCCGDTPALVAPVAPRTCVDCGCVDVAADGCGYSRGADLIAAADRDGRGPLPIGPLTEWGPRQWYAVRVSIKLAAELAKPAP